MREREKEKPERQGVDVRKDVACDKSARHEVVALRVV